MFALNCVKHIISNSSKSFVNTFTRIVLVKKISSLSPAKHNVRFFTWSELVMWPHPSLPVNGKKKCFNETFVMIHLKNQLICLFFILFRCFHYQLSIVTFWVLHNSRGNGAVANLNRETYDSSISIQLQKIMNNYISSFIIKYKRSFSK